MTALTLARNLRKMGGWCVVLLGFAISLSTAADGILTALLLLAWLIALPTHFRESLRTYANVKPALFGLMIFGMLVVSAAYSGVPWKVGFASAAKYLDLALIPIFVWAAAMPGVRSRTLYACAVAIALNLLVSYGTAVGFWDSFPGTRTGPQYPVGFRLSITYSILVSLTGFAFLLVARDVRSRSRPAAIAALGFAIVCIHNVLFVVISRTGYLLMAAFLVYFMITVVRSRRSVLLAALMMTALFASAYVGSNAFPMRVQDVASEVMRWKPSAPDETSIGLRMGYYRTTLQMISERPLIGVGAGGFESAYAEAIRGTGAPATRNAHNDYLMIAVQAGIPAAILLVALYIMLWRDAARLSTPLDRDLMRGLVMTMAFGGMANSLLMDHVEGLLLAWAAGLLYAGRRSGTACTRLK